MFRHCRIQNMRRERDTRLGLAIWAHDCNFGRISSQGVLQPGNAGKQRGGVHIRPHAQERNRKTTLPAHFFRQALDCVIRLQPVCIKRQELRLSCTIGQQPAADQLGVGAIAVFAVLRRRSDRPEYLFRWIALGVLLLSFPADLWLLSDGAAGAFPGATPTGVTVLMVMHVVAAAVIVWGLTVRHRFPSSA